ncbi:hypothetical protein DYY67_0266 [Candidatus Nitrosotalea sp. TS]|uniref:hypothetical protein n=1 Tax=Candidatus Nitrosotalea sp. TS TaxID=2341020 RepID=UPI00140CF40B|nr:hypothetical protein [Candidatus Nitrosotalea sp. TS]NHI03145.1 hypothetical protein [Candidatus Nitrosotalea sp. TS]
MIRQNKRSIKLRLVILVAIYAALIPFSLVWYSTLTHIDCNITKPLSSNSVKIGSSEERAQSCGQQLSFHWIKFYGINGAIYAASLVAFVVNMKKNKG